MIYNLKEQKIIHKNLVWAKKWISFSGLILFRLMIRKMICLIWWTSCEPS